MSVEETVRAMITHALATAPKPVAPPDCSPHNLILESDGKAMFVTMVIGGRPLGRLMFDRAQYDRLLEIMKRHRPEA